MVGEGAIEYLLKLNRYCQKRSLRREARSGIRGRSERDASLQRGRCTLYLIPEAQLNAQRRSRTGRVGQPYGDDGKRGPGGGDVGGQGENQNESERGKLWKTKVERRGEVVGER